MNMSVAHIWLKEFTMKIRQSSKEKYNKITWKTMVKTNTLNVRSCLYLHENMPTTQLQHNIKYVKLSRYSVAYYELASQLIISYTIIKAELSQWRDVLHCKQHNVREHQIIMIIQNKLNHHIRS